MVLSALVIASCNPVTNPGPPADNNGVPQTNAGNSEALNDLNRSERYENVQRINEKVVRRSKDHFKSIGRGAGDTLVMTHKLSVSSGASLRLQFDMIHQQASLLSLRLQSRNDRCLYPDFYILVLDGNSFKVVPKRVSRLQDRDCLEWTLLSASDYPLMIQSLEQARTATLEIHYRNSIQTIKISGQQLSACRETLEYYTALGGAQ